MRTHLIYDLPTRLFHWLFAGLFLTSFVIGKTVDDESLVFSYHMLSGILLGSLVLWRILWGVWGSQHARFTGFNLHPIQLKEYLVGIIWGSKKRWSGHNPASSWAAITMFSLALGLTLTGYLMSTGYKESLEDIHELLANSFILIVILHILGILLHSFRHQDSIALSMMDGKKACEKSEASLPSAHYLAAAILIGLFISLSLYLFNNFDSQQRTLNLMGQSLQLGENEIDNESDSQIKKQENEENEKDEDHEENK